MADRTHPLSSALTRRAVVAGATAGLAAGALAMAPRGSAQDATPVGTPVGGSLIIYCGRNEELVAPVFADIASTTGITLDIRYGNTAELAAQLLEEGGNTPAGLYFGQDAGALGALAQAGVLGPLPQATLDRVAPEFRSDDGLWVGVSGRARVLVYNTDEVDPATLPASIVDLPETELPGPIGWAPSNASFQSFVTALRVTAGEDAARDWLEAMVSAGAITYEGNGAVLQAAGTGEIAVGLVNHYYLYEALRENPDLPVANYYFPGGDLGSLINVAGAGVVAGTDQMAQAEAVVAALLGEAAQTYFSDETSEYPLIDGIPAQDSLPPLADLVQPDIDLSDLADLEGTLSLLTDLGLI